MFQNKQSSPKSFGNSQVATPHGREWTCPLRVLAVQYQLQTNSPLSHWYEITVTFQLISCKCQL